MRVLVLRNDPVELAGFGGAYSHIKGIVKGFLKNEMEVIYAGFVGLDIHHPSLSQILLHAQYFPSAWFKRIMSNFNVLKRCREILMKEKFLFIYHRLCLNDISPLLLRRKFKIPLVTEFNGSEVWVAKNWSHSRNPLLFISLIIENRVLSKTDFIITISNRLKEVLQENKIPGERILVNPNGFDEELFKKDMDVKETRKKYKLPSDSIIVGYSGSFEGFHGVEVLARSAVEVVRKKRDVFFLFIGDGKRRKEVERIVSEGNISRNCIFTRRVGHEVSAELISSCDILVAPHDFRKWGEFFGSPTKLFEYMGAGKAIIASSVGQIKEIIRNGENGLTFEEGNSEELSEKILMLAENEDLRKRLGERARIEAFSKYTWKEHCRKIIDFVSSKCGVKRC